MTLNKKRVRQELRDDATTKERLYNFIARQVLDKIPFQHATDRVELIVDKCKGRRQIADFNQYVLRQLQGRLDPRVRIDIYHRLSHTDHGLSAVDLFCWGIARHHQRDDDEWYDDFRDKIILDEVYLE
jgi:hypothetical protein